MSTGLVLFFITCVSLVQLSQGLRCRVDHDQRTQEEFKDVVRACMSSDMQDQDRRPNNNNRNRNNNNNSNGNGWQHRQPEWGQGIPRFPTRDNRDGGNNREEEDGEDSREATENPHNRGRGGYNRGRGPRSRRAAQVRPQPHGNQRRDHTREPNQSHGHGFSLNQNRNHTENRHDESSVLENIEPLDKENHPDRRAILNVMTGQLRDQELRGFLRDAISECFESLESESQDTKCSATKSFAMCLEQKGQQNCDDWNEDMKTPYHKQGSISNNNNNYSNRG